MKKTREFSDNKNEIISGDSIGGVALINFFVPDAALIRGRRFLFSQASERPKSLIRESEWLRTATTLLFLFLHLIKQVKLNIELINIEGICETGPTVYSPYPRRLESLTILLM